MRTKHCRNCNKCVATYDHHCPWIGNCVAEKNRVYFFVFLVVLFIEIIMTLYIFIQAYIPSSELDQWFNNNLFALCGSIITGFFFLMVGSLLCIHLYLASNNLTTWEFLSWNKISYMKVWPKIHGSPFSQGKGKLYNLSLYFCP